MSGNNSWKSALRLLLATAKPVTGMRSAVTSSTSSDSSSSVSSLPEEYSLGWAKDGARERVPDAFPGSSREDICLSYLLADDMDRFLVWAFSTAETDSLSCSANSFWGDMATVSPEMAIAEANPVGFLFGDLERDFLMESKVPPPKKDLDRELLTERIEAASESFCLVGERKAKELEGMLFVVKLLVIAGTGGTGEVGDSTRGSLREEVTRLSFDVSTVNEELLPRFERILEGCGAASVA